jgi:DNA invertase Pin-like site-specific DNA recombinase
MKRAVIYARVSSVGDRQSTDRQVVDLREYATTSKMELVNTFEEHISGAKKNQDRPVLMQAIDYCKANRVDILLCSELSRVGRSSFEVLATVKDLIDHKINLYLQKEKFTLLDDEGKPSMLAPIIISVLSTCAQLERDNIQFRLNSGRRQYIENGGVLGRPKGSSMTHEQKREQYKELLAYLKKGYSQRIVARLSNVSLSTVERCVREFKEELRQ